MGDAERGYAGACRNQRICSVARRATAFDPKDHYQTAEAMRRAVVAAFGDEAGEPGPVTRGVAASATGGVAELDDDELDFCPNCGAILNAQEGFATNNGFWTCRACGQQLFGDGVYAGLWLRQGSYPRSCP